VVEGQRQIVKTTVYEKDKALLQKQLRTAQTQSQDRATFQRELTVATSRSKFKEALAITPCRRDRLSRIVITVRDRRRTPNRTITGAAVWDRRAARLAPDRNLPPAGATDYTNSGSTRVSVPVSAGCPADPAARATCSAPVPRREPDPHGHLGGRRAVQYAEGIIRGSRLRITPCIPLWKLCRAVIRLAFSPFS
jgi:hypothetical protein